MNDSNLNISKNDILNLGFDNNDADKILSIFTNVVEKEPWLNKRFYFFYIIGCNYAKN